MTSGTKKALWVWIAYAAVWGHFASAAGGGGGGSTDPLDDTAYLTRTGLDTRLQADDQSIMGDVIDPNTGTVVFNQTDVSLPGNSHLDVSLRRRLVPGELKPEINVGFGTNWELEVPRIWMLIANASNTKNPGGNWDLNRCTNPGNPGAVTTGTSTYQAYEYWDGLNLQIPGQGTRKVLDSPAGAQWPSGTSKVTSDNWRLTCIADIGTANGGGQGFYVTAPNGDRYRMDRLFQVQARAYMRFNSTNLTRKSAMLVATEVTDVSGNWVRYTYNSVGKPTQITSNDGRTITITYDTSNRVTQVAANGRTWIYSYVNGGGGIGSITLPDGRQWSFSVSGFATRPKDDVTCPAADVSISMTHPNGATGTYTFGERVHGRTYTPTSGAANRGPRAGVCGYDGAIIVKSFHVMSLLSKTLSGPGYPSATWSYSYSTDAGAYTNSGGLPDTKWTKIIDPLGRKIIHYYDRRWGDTEGLETRIETYATDAATSPDEVVDLSDIVESAVGSMDMFSENVAKLTKPRRSALTTVARGLDTYTTRDTYDSNFSSATYSFGFPTKVESWSSVSAVARVSDIVYLHDKVNWRLGLPSTVTKNGILFDSYFYDSISRLTEHRKFGSTYHTLAYRTDAGQEGTIAYVDDALSRRTQFLNYKRGLPQQVIRADGRSMYRTIDDNGWVTSETNYRGYVTSYQYNSMGWPTLIDRPGTWADSTFSYTGLGGAFQQTETRGNRRSVTSYDSFQRVYQTADIDLTGVGGSIYSRTDLNALNLLTYKSYPYADSTTPVGRTTSYDSLLRAKTIQENVAPFATTTYDYLPSNRVRVTDPAGAQAITSYSAYGSPDVGDVIQVVDAMGVTTDITRDIYGKITQTSQIANQNGFATNVVRTWSYDARQRACRHHAPELGDEIYAYDSLDRLVAVAKGQPVGAGCVAPPPAASVAFTYDAIDRRIGVDYPDTTPDVTYGYDQNSNLLSVQRGGTAWSYAYNEVDLLTQEKLTVDTRTFQFDYGYDTTGNLASRTTPSGITVQFAPDGLGRATRAQVGATSYISGASYFANGILASASYANGQVLTQTLDATQRLYDLRTEKAGGPAVQFSRHTYDARGKITQIVDSTYANYGGQFTYDANGRLTTANTAEGSRTITYDGNGNIRQHVIPTGTFAIDYGADNRISTATFMGTTRNFAYDARGNTINDGLKTYVYDMSDQPTSITTATAATYSYDGNFKRVRQDDTNGTSYTIYSKLSGQLIYLENVTQNTKVDFVNVGTANVRLTNATTAEYVHSDHLGSSIAGTDASGAVTWREEYTPTGGNRIRPVANRNRPGFTGHLRDFDTALVYMQARYYDGVTGRFLSPDPAGYQDGGNLYAYVGNDFVNSIDPKGLCIEDACILDGAAMAWFFHAFVIATADGIQQTNQNGGSDGGSEGGSNSGSSSGPPSQGTLSNSNNSSAGASAATAPPSGLEPEDPERSRDRNLSRERPQRYSGRYADGTKAQRTNVPRNANNDPVPDENAGGPHSRLQMDAANPERVYSATEFDANGQAVKRVDFAGRKGETVPHEHPYNPETKAFEGKQNLSN